MTTTLPHARVLCDRCAAPISAASCFSGKSELCPGCRDLIETQVFPALCAPPPVVAQGDRIVLDDDAGCFYHEDRKAEAICDSCGRFLCALCEIDLDAQCLCPQCLSSGLRPELEMPVKSSAILYDRVALALAVVPALAMVTAGLTVVTAPAAMFLTLRYWRTQKTLLPRHRWRFVVAGIAAGLQIVLWLVFAGLLAVGVLKEGLS